MKRLIPIVLAAVLLGAVVLAALASHPPVLYGNPLPQDYIEAVEAQAKGVYSRTLPLIPVCVTADKTEDDTLFYTIYYFPFGTVEMSYTPDDGYNIEKPLSGLS